VGEVWVQSAISLVTRGDAADCRDLAEVQGLLSTDMQNTIRGGGSGGDGSGSGGSGSTRRGRSRLGRSSGASQQSSGRNSFGMMSPYLSSGARSGGTMPHGLGDHLIDSNGSQPAISVIDVPVLSRLGPTLWPQAVLHGLRRQVSAAALNSWRAVKQELFDRLPASTVDLPIRRLRLMLGQAISVRQRGGQTAAGADAGAICALPILSEDVIGGIVEIACASLKRMVSIPGDVCVDLGGTPRPTMAMRKPDSLSRSSEHDRQDEEYNDDYGYERSSSSSPLLKAHEAKEQLAHGNVEDETKHEDGDVDEKAGSLHVQTLLSRLLAAGATLGVVAAVKSWSEYQARLALGATRSTAR